MREMKSILQCAGLLKRKMVNASTEDVIILRSLAEVT
jgi:hypothetical protein